MTEETQQQMRAYLLGLDNAGLEEFEGRVFSDDALYQEMLEEQNALIDDYVSGRLSANQERRFQDQCRLSPTLRQRVAELRDLRTALEKHRVPGREEHGKSRPRFVWPIPSFVGIAALLLAFITLHSHPRSAPGPVAQVATAAPQLQPKAPAALVFFLPNLVTRGPSDETVLKLPAHAAAVDLQLELARTTAIGSQWKIEICHGADRPCRSSSGAAQQTGQIIYVVTHLEPQDGEYVVHLSPSAPDQMPLTRTFLIKRQP